MVLMPKKKEILIITRTTQPNTPLLPALSFCGGDVGTQRWAPHGWQPQPPRCPVPLSGTSTFPGDQHLPRHSRAGTGCPGTQRGSQGTCCDGHGAALVLEPSSKLSRSDPEPCSVPPWPWSPGSRCWWWGLRRCPSMWSPAPCCGPERQHAGSCVWG